MYRFVTHKREREREIKLIFVLLNPLLQILMSVWKECIHVIAMQYVTTPMEDLNVYASLDMKVMGSPVRVSAQIQCSVKRRTNY